MHDVTDIEWIVTSSESDAFLLESQLIKTFRPRYNIALKDDKSYPYIRISPDAFPRLSITRDKRRDKAQYFGPFVSFGSARYLLKVIQDIFPIRDCKQSIDLVDYQPKCINLDIGRCLGPCVKKDTRDDYLRVVQDLTLFLSGKERQLLNLLTARMHDHAHHKHFEKAARCRDQIEYLSRLRKRRVLMEEDGATYDVWCGQSNESFHYVLVQTFVDGRFLYQKGYYCDVRDMDFQDYVAQSVNSHYGDRDDLPDYVLTSDVLSFLKDTFSLMLSELNVTIQIPQRGIKRDTVRIASRNVKAALDKLVKEKYFSVSVDSLKTLDLMMARLQLPQVPLNIWGFDISHLQGQDIVASSVCFKQGKPSKKDYRKFYIRSVKDDSNDPQSIYEAVKRRLQRALDESTELPQLLIIDGGKAQLSFACKACRELGLMDTISVISLAKREELIFKPNQIAPIQLSRHDPCLRLCQFIRDESHRVAVSFQRLTRRKKCQSVLESIPGLGPKRIQALYKHFGSIENIQKASVEDVRLAAHISSDLAENVIVFCRSLFI